MTAHSTSIKVLDPQAGEYDSWDLRLYSPKNGKTFGPRESLSQWADVIGFIHEPVLVNKISDKSSVGVGRGGARLLEIERTPAYVAGNRYHMKGAIALPLPPANTWNAFAHALYSTSGIDVFNRDKP